MASWVEQFDENGVPTDATQVCDQQLLVFMICKPQAACCSCDRVTEEQGSVHGNARAPSCTAVPLPADG